MTQVSNPKKILKDAKGKPKSLENSFGTSTKSKVRYVPKEKVLKYDLGLNHISNSPQFSSEISSEKSVVESIVDLVNQHVESESMVESVVKNMQEYIEKKH